MGLGGYRWCNTEPVEAERQESRATAVGQEAKVADAYEPFREDVQQEASQELVERQCHEFLLVLVGGVTPAEGDPAGSNGDQAMVGDGHAVGVAAEVVQHMLRATEGTFQIHDPVLPVERPDPGGEGLGLGEQCQISCKAQLTIAESLLKSGNELTTEHSTQDQFGEEEVFAGRDPEGVIGAEPTGRNHAVHVGMQDEFLAPGVQDAEEAVEIVYSIDLFQLPCEDTVQWVN